MGPGSQSPTDGPELEAFFDSTEFSSRVGVFRSIVYAPMLMPDGSADTFAGGRSIGDDRIQLERTDAVALMHELGHALGLMHGGETAEEVDADPSLPSAGRNCKPNHLSIMNYRYTSGIPYITGTYATSKFLVDFSPSMIPDDEIVSWSSLCPTGSRCNRRLPLLPSIDENAYQLIEDEVFLVDDFPAGIAIRHQFDFWDPAGNAVRTGVWDENDWDGDGVISPDPLPIAINLDLDPSDPADGPCGANRNGAVTV